MGTAAGDLSLGRVLVPGHPGARARARFKKPGVLFTHSCIMYPAFVIHNTK
jgi:hypothetical protein